MLRFDLITIPLLAGYIFLISFNLTRFYNIRVDRQQLVFNALLCSVGITFFTFIFDFYVLKSEPLLFYRAYFSQLIDWIVGRDTMTFGFKHLLLALLIAFPLAKFLNLFYSRKSAFAFTIRKFGSQLDRLFWFSITAKKDEDKLLMFATNNNEVYIGYVSEISEPLGDPYIRIIPTAYGNDDEYINVTSDLSVTLKKVL